MNKSKYAVDICETAEIDGSRYHLRYRTKNPRNPVLLFLHGGPGSCDRPLVMKYQSQLADAFTVVCWDQRGAGKAYDFKTSENEKMTVDTCVQDAHAVVGFLKQRFSQDKVYIVGHSWGSILGVLLAQRYPDDLAAYVGIGQYVWGEENERLSYEFTLNEARRRRDKRAIRILEKIDERVVSRNSTDKDFITQRNYLQKFGGAMYNQRESIAWFALKVMFTTLEYTLLDCVRYIKGNAHCRKTLYDDMMRLNFFEGVKSLDMPVLITQGRHDYNTPSVIAKRWFDALDAPEKEYIWFENSAHSPDFEEPALWAQTIRRVLNRT